MDKDLKRVTQLLRAETCPPQVLDRVRAKIADERRQTYHRRMAYAAAVTIAIVASLAFFKIAQRPVPIDPQVAVHKEQQRIYQEASLSLAYIGHQLHETGSSTGERVLRGTMLGVMKGFQKASKAFTKPSDPPNNQPEK